MPDVSGRLLWPSANRWHQLHRRRGGWLAAGYVPKYLSPIDSAGVSAGGEQATLVGARTVDQTDRTDAMLLQVRNRHSAEAGIPPWIDNLRSNQYVGYFENAYGEQALFIYDRDARMGTLYLGDAGWETPHAVINGAVPDLVLSETELLWLRACWQACRGT